VSGRLLELQDSGGASSPRATVASGAWVHAPPQKIQATGEIRNSFFPSSFLASGDL